MIHPMKFFTTHAVVKRISPPKIQTCWDANPDLCDKTAVQHSNQCMSDIVGAVHTWCAGTSAWVLVQNGTWYVIVYILVPAIFKLSREYKIMDFPRTNRNSMKPETWCWLLCPSTKSRLFTQVPALCLKF